MDAPSFSGLLIVVAVAFAVPFTLGLLPQLRLPAVVLEIVLGIVIGPAVLGWVEIDTTISVIALIGLVFLLFLAGLEIEFEHLRGRVLKLAGLAWVASFAIAVVIGYALEAGGLVQTPLLVAVILSATSLGVIIPVLKDAGEIATPFGQLVVAAGTIADFGAIILLSVLFTGEGGGTTTTLLLIGALLAMGVRAVPRRHGRGALAPCDGRPGAPAGHDRPDSRPRRGRRPDRVRGARREARPGDHPRRVRGGRGADARRPRSLHDPPAVSHEARCDRLRLLHPGLLRLQRRALRPRRAGQQHGRARQGAGVRARAAGDPRPAGAAPTGATSATGGRSSRGSSRRPRCRSSSPRRRSASSSGSSAGPSPPRSSPPGCCRCSSSRSPG